MTQKERKSEQTYNKKRDWISNQNTEYYLQSTQKLVDKFS